MAIVVPYQPDEVQNAPAATPQMSMSDPVAAAGEKMGATLDHVADDAAILARQAQASADNTVAQGQAATYLKANQTLMGGPMVQDTDTGVVTSGFLNAKGTDALNNVDWAQGASDQLRQQSRDALNNPRQQAVFDEITRHIPLQNQVALERHEYVEGQAVAVENYNSLLAAQYTDYATKINDMGPDGTSLASLQAIQQTVRQGMADQHGLALGSNDPADPVNAAVRAATDKAISGNIITLLGPDGSGATAAKAALDANRPYLSANAVSVLDKALAPSLTVSTAQNILSEVDDNLTLNKYLNDDEGTDTKAPSVEDRYNAAKALTSDPNVLKLIRTTVETEDTLHKKALNDNYEALSGPLLMKGQQDWIAGRPTDINAIMKDPSFAQMDATQQSKLLDKFRIENGLIASEIRKQATDNRLATAAENSAAAASRSAANQAQAIKDAEQQTQWDKNAAHYRANPGIAAKMTNQAWEAEAQNMGKSDYDALSTQRAHDLKSPQNAAASTIGANQVTTLLNKANITDPTFIKQVYANKAQILAANDPDGKATTEQQGQYILKAASDTVLQNQDHWYGAETVAVPRVAAQGSAITDYHKVVVPFAANAHYNIIEMQRGITLSPAQRQEMYYNAKLSGRPY